MGVLLLQTNNALITLENQSKDAMQQRFERLDSTYHAGFELLQDSITAVNGRVTVAELRHSTQLNAINYLIQLNDRRHEELNNMLADVTNDSLLLLLTEQLSEVDTTQRD